MIKSRWIVRCVRREWSARPVQFAASLPTDWPAWLSAVDVPVGTPFLISPEFGYDVELNAFFRSPAMVAAARNTQVGYARDLKGFLNFLWSGRGRLSWRDAQETDHVAYLHWRRFDPLGPHVDGRTWDREVAAVNRFYGWQVRSGNVRVNPIPHRDRRPAPLDRGLRTGGEPGGAEQTPATYSHSAGREKIEWFPAASYRLWRDVGMRGYTPEGLPDPRFRGRWAGRNATFCDLMVRTGLRLSEQAALTVFEVPLQAGGGAYRRFWLPPSIAKGGSARWVYVPASLIADLLTYAEIDRADVVATAQADGRYSRMAEPLVVEDPARPVAFQPHPAGGGHWVKVAHLDGDARRRLLIDGPRGLEPAAFWLSESGMPVAVSTWKSLFTEANTRCRSKGVALHGHAHLLRHSFAVITLEQLQRGHIAALAELDPAQRGHYTRVFGDPLDWVRRRLGHRSITTTQIYLHALAELEMHTRMALVPDAWEDPRDLSAAQLADESRAESEPAQ